MIALAIIGIFMAQIAVWLGMYWQPKTDGRKLLRDTVCVVMVAASTMIIGNARENIAYKDALDGNNPYHKEYVYRTLPDGEKVLTDSIYVKTEDND